MVKLILKKINHQISFAIIRNILAGGCICFSASKKLFINDRRFKKIV